MFTTNLSQYFRAQNIIYINHRKYFHSLCNFSNYYFITQNINKTISTTFTYQIFMIKLMQLSDITDKNPKEIF